MASCEHQHIRQHGAGRHGQSTCQEKPVFCLKHVVFDNQEILVNTTDKGTGAFSCAPTETIFPEVKIPELTRFRVEYGRSGAPRRDH